MTKQGSDASPPDQTEMSATEKRPCDQEALPQPQTLEEWSEEMLRKMEELHGNEALRREISRRLS